MADGSRRHRASLWQRPGAPRAQAGPQEAAARRPAADEAEAGVRRRPGWRTRRWWRPWRRRRPSRTALIVLRRFRLENAGLTVRVFVLDRCILRRALCLSMIFSENRFPLFRIML